MKASRAHRLWYVIILRRRNLNEHRLLANLLRRAGWHGGTIDRRRALVLVSLAPGVPNRLFGQRDAVGVTGNPATSVFTTRNPNLSAENSLLFTVAVSGTIRRRADFPLSHPRLDRPDVPAHVVETRRICLLVRGSTDDPLLMVTPPSEIFSRPVGFLPGQRPPLFSVDTQQLSDDHAVLMGWI